MSRAVCGVCFCPYGDEGDCACSTETHYKKVIDDVQALFDAKREQETKEKAMDKKTEALKLALEALEFYDQQGIGRIPGDKAITAIREALAEQPAPVAEPHEQQEPVAWYDEEYDCAYTAAELDGGTVDGLIPLYTSPPASKPWVGLTDEEFQMIYDLGRTSAGMIEMAEAKLKEKNT